MSVEQPKVIDVIGVDKTSGEVVLTISDHLDWLTCREHEHFLQSKLNTYLAFIESGEIYTTYPDAIGRPSCISIRSLHEPNEEGLRFLSVVKRTIEGAGVSFLFEVATPI